MERKILSQLYYISFFVCFILFSVVSQEMLEGQLNSKLKVNVNFEIDSYKLVIKTIDSSINSKAYYTGKINKFAAVKIYISLT